MYDPEAAIMKHDMCEKDKNSAKSFWLILVYNKQSFIMTQDTDFCFKNFAIFDMSNQQLVMNGF